ncbi:MAG: cysteine desulfurase-like protein [Aggregatilineales bacterium]
MNFPIDAVREQFPALRQPATADTLPVFLDNPAGTQVPQRVIDAVRDYYVHNNANSGGVFATSQRTDVMVGGVRAKMAAFLNAPLPQEIVFGPNMTTLTFALSRALAQTLQAGDEIVLTRMDHDANIEPWRRAAADRGLTVRWADIHDDCTLDLNSLEAALTDRTRVVATVHASNAVGTINPVQQIAEMAHAVGALYVVDAVQSAPHIPVDVQAIGCDVLLCSAYKFFGPHIGVLWGRYDLLASLPAYKVRPASDRPPHRWETGTPSFETIAGVGAALDYFVWLGRLCRQIEPSIAHNGGDAQRRDYLAAFEAIGQYERELGAHLIEALQGLPGVELAGITDPARMDQRVPTVAFTMAGRSPRDVAAHLAQQHIYVWHGNYYAVEIMKRLGYEAHGMVRVGPVHYNTHAEIDRLEAALRQLD